MEFCRTEQVEDDKYIEDTEQTTRLKTNFVISAFGSGLYEVDGKISRIFRIVYRNVSFF